jgi:hypothetical protein
VSYLEIYNESVNDLLNPSSQNLKIFDDPGRGLVVEGLGEEIVGSIREVLGLMERGGWQWFVDS